MDARKRKYNRYVSDVALLNFTGICLKKSLGYSNAKKEIRIQQCTPITMASFCPGLIGPFDCSLFYNGDCSGINPVLIQDGKPREREMERARWYEERYETAMITHTFNWIVFECLGR